MRNSSPLLTGLALALLALAAPVADAQTIYKCAEGDRTVFSDTPCPGAAAMKQSKSGVTTPVGAAAQGVATTAAAATTAPADPAADLDAPAVEDDTKAPRWTTVSRREIEYAQNPRDRRSPKFLEVEITIECEDTGLQELVVARPDLNRYTLPNGVAYTSLEAAALARCK